MTKPVIACAILAALFYVPMIVVNTVYVAPSSVFRAGFPFGGMVQAALSEGFHPVLLVFGAFYAGFAIAVLAAILGYKQHPLAGWAYVVAGALPLVSLAIMLPPNILAIIDSQNMNTVTGPADLMMRVLRKFTPALAVYATCALYVLWVGLRIVRSPRAG